MQTIFFVPQNFLSSAKCLHTCEDLLSQVGEELEVDEALDDSLECAELRVEAQGEEHHEEEDGPEVAAGELVHRLREQDESQAGAARRLQLRIHDFLIISVLIFRYSVNCYMVLTNEN